MINFYTLIEARANGEIQEKMGPFSERTAEQIARGARINLDHVNYRVRVVEGDPEEKA